MRYLMALCVLGLVACDDGDSSSDNTTTDGDGTLGVAVADLSQWGLEACPDGLDDVDGICVAGSVDMQLDIDDCRAVAHCFEPRVVAKDGSLIEDWSGIPSCARSVALAWIDEYTGQSWDGGTVAQWAAYRSWSELAPEASDESRGLHIFSGFNNRDGVERELKLDELGLTGCLIDAEANVVQDRWKWSKVRQTLIAEDRESRPERW